MVLLIEIFSPGAAEQVDNSNTTNLPESDLDQPIYRIMPFLRCLELLHTKQIVLVRLCKWDDPFENALLKAAIIIGQSASGTYGFKHSVYGQCWTSELETDAMWRIYSHDKQGIKAKTTPRKLLNALREDFVVSKGVSRKWIHQQAMSDVNRYKGIEQAHVDCH